MKVLSRFRAWVRAVDKSVWGLAMLLALYAVLGGVSLGSARAVHGEWRARTTLITSPASAIVKFTLSEIEKTDGDGKVTKEKVPLSEIWMNFGSVDSTSEPAKVRVEYSTSSNSSNWFTSTFGSAPAEIAADDCYQWVRTHADFSLSTIYDHLRISAYTSGESDDKYVSPDFSINEIALIDERGNLVPIEIVNPDTVNRTDKNGNNVLDANGNTIKDPVPYNQSRLADEQDRLVYDATLDDEGNLLTGMLAEKPILGRAGSRIDRFTPKERRAVAAASDLLGGRGFVVDSSVPPLGTLLIAAGVGIFGETTLGVRIVPYLFGAGLLVALYFFGKKLFKGGKYGLLLSLLFLLSGLGLAAAISGTAGIVAAFFVLLAYSFLYDFYRYGVDGDHKFASAVPIILSGVFFALALASDLRSVYALFGIVAVTALSLFRQYRRYRERASLAAAEKQGATEGDGETAARENKGAAEEKRKYLEKLGLSLGCFLVAYLLSIGVFLVLVYGIAMQSYGSYYETGSVFTAMGKDLAGMLRRGSAAGETNAFGWLVNFRAETVYPSSAIREGYTNAAYAFFNLALLVLCLASLMYATILIIAAAARRKTLGARDAAAVKAIVRPYFVLVLGSIATLLFALAGGADGMSAFLTASLFYLAFPVLVWKTTEYSEKKVLFTVNGKAVTATGLVAAVLLAVAVAFFALMLPGIVGYEMKSKAASSLFQWFFRR